MSTLPPSPLRTLRISSKPLPPVRAWVGARTHVRVPRLSWKACGWNVCEQDWLSAKVTAASQRQNAANPCAVQGAVILPDESRIFLGSSGVVFKEERMNLPHG